MAQDPDPSPAALDTAGSTAKNLGAILALGVLAYGGWQFLDRLYFDQPRIVVREVAHLGRGEPSSPEVRLAVRFSIIGRKHGSAYLNHFRLYPTTPPPPMIMARVIDSHAMEVEVDLDASWRVGAITLRQVANEIPLDGRPASPAQLLPLPRFEVASKSQEDFDLAVTIHHSNDAPWPDGDAQAWLGLAVDWEKERGRTERELMTRFRLPLRP